MCICFLRKDRQGVYSDGSRYGKESERVGGRGIHNQSILYEEEFHTRILKRRKIKISGRK